jgi:Holliday junction resolvase RusA-like endonuclease
MTELRFTIPGPPVPKGRPKFTVITAGRKRIVRTYTPAETVEAERLVRLAARKVKPAKLLDGPLSIEFLFVMPRLVKHAKLTVLPTWCTGVIDIDNCEKLVQDALNEYLYVDDRQIVRKRSEQIYGDNPRTEVTIRTLTEDEAPGSESSLSLFKT